MCVRLDLGKGMAFLGVCTGADPLLIEWQHLLPVDWRGVRIGMARAGLA